MISLESASSIPHIFLLDSNEIPFDTRLLNTLILLLLGTKCVDDNTGLIYFKYDFGYEFGILFPGEGRKYVAGCNKYVEPISKFLHNSAGAIDIPVVHEKTIKQNLWKQRNKNDIYDLMGRKKPFCKNQPTVSFNIDELHNDLPRIKQHIPRKGAFFFFIIDKWTFVNFCFVLQLIASILCVKLKMIGKYSGLLQFVHSNRIQFIYFFEFVGIWLSYLMDYLLLNYVLYLLFPNNYTRCCF